MSVHLLLGLHETYCKGHGHDLDIDCAALQAKEQPSFSIYALKLQMPRRLTTVMVFCLLSPASHSALDLVSDTCCICFNASLATTQSIGIR